MDELLRNPITGIADCCARAASGHVAAAPPINVMNSRRFMCPDATVMARAGPADLPRTQGTTEGPAGPWGSPELF